MEQHFGKAASKDAPSWAGTWERGSSSPEDAKQEHLSGLAIRRDSVMNGLIDLSVKNLSHPMSPEEKKSIGEFLNRNFDRLASADTSTNGQPQIKADDLVAAFRRDNWPDGKKLSNNDREMLRETALHYSELSLPGQTPYAIERSDVADYLKGATVKSEDGNYQRVTTQFPDGSSVDRLAYPSWTVKADGKGNVEAKGDDLSIKLPKTGDGEIAVGSWGLHASIALQQVGEGKWQGKLASGDDIQIAFDNKGVTIDTDGMHVRGDEEGVAVKDTLGDSLFTKDSVTLPSDAGPMKVTGDWQTKKVDDQKGRIAVDYGHIAWVESAKEGITISGVDDSRTDVPDIFVDREGKVFRLNRDGSKVHQFEVGADGLANETLPDGTGVTQNKDGSLTIRFKSARGAGEEWSVLPNGRLTIREMSENAIVADDATSPDEAGHAVRSFMGLSPGGVYEAPDGTKFDLVPQLANRSGTPQ